MEVEASIETRENEDASEIDPFAYFPNAASGIKGLGGNEAGSVTGYAFHTAYCPLRPGAILLRVQFTGLSALDGTLLVQVFRHEESRGGPIAIVESATVRLRDAVATGGEIVINFRSIAGMTYAIFGKISETTEISAEALRIVAEPVSLAPGLVETPSQTKSLKPAASKVRSSPRLLSLNPATLCAPVSQMCASAQLREDIFRQWYDRLSIARLSQPDQWKIVYVLQALTRYGFLGDGATGLGFIVDGDPVVDGMKSTGCDLMLVDQGDAGAESLESDNVDHKPVGNAASGFADYGGIRRTRIGEVPGDLRDFDFVWSHSITDRLNSIRDAFFFIEDSLRCLSPGGLAVHVVRASGNGGDNGQSGRRPLAFARQDIQRLALNIVSNGHDIAELKFDSENANATSSRTITRPPMQDLFDDALPFGIIIRKG